MANDINRAVHQAMRLGCWHAFDLKDRSTDDYIWRCDCGLETQNPKMWQPQPDYAGSLDAASVFERFVVEKVGAVELHKVLYPMMEGPGLNAIAQSAFADAKTRCLAGLRKLNIEVNKDGE